MATRVDPTGQIGAPFAIVIDSPDEGETKPLDNAVNSIVWPLLRHQGIRRQDCWVTCFSKEPLDDDAELTDAQFDVLAPELCAELNAVGPHRILSFGALSARALIGSDDMRMLSGVAWPYLSPNKLIPVVPTWLPSAALNSGGEDLMAWIGAAIANFTRAQIPEDNFAPLPEVWNGVFPMHHTIAIDTEGTPDDPFCLTFGYQDRRVFVPAELASDWWRCYGKHAHTHIYHHALWDWAVMEAMGIPDPHLHQFVDTMELAYLKQTEPQGLKALAGRYLRIFTKDWQDTVRPAWEEALLAYATGQVEADTVVDRLTKTGKPRKKPIMRRGPVAKALYKAVEKENTELLAKKLPDFPPMNSNQVPLHTMVEYATLDPWMTYKIWEKLK